jgi:hypothetical protein
MSTKSFLYLAAAAIAASLVVLCVMEQRLVGAIAATVSTIASFGLYVLTVATPKK